MSRLVHNARQIARCIVDVTWNLQHLTEILDPMLTGGPSDPRRLAARLIYHGGEERSPRFTRIVDILCADDQFRKQFAGANLTRVIPGVAQMQPMPSHLSTLPLPQLCNQRELARWLGLSDTELAWFAGLDRRYTASLAPKYDHYHYTWQDRRSGPPRLLEKPKGRLKALQREILAAILNQVPMHDDAHGFRRHRSCRSAALPHCGQDVLLRMDLKDFFLSVNRARVKGIFRLVGYPESVATCLAGLCTHRTQPQAWLESARSPTCSMRQRLQNWHLPQGAPTSPALANLSAWRLDTRLSGLAERMGLNYSRYADDLAYSGPDELSRRREFIEALIGAIALEEGFAINFRKTRWMRSSQRQIFCGVVVNRHPNLERGEYDQLKALLHNCIKYGPESQNLAGHPDFRRHLEGRVSHAQHLNPARGAKLARLLHRIVWQHGLDEHD